MVNIISILPEGFRVEPPTFMTRLKLQLVLCHWLAFSIRILSEILNILMSFGFFDVFKSLKSLAITGN